VIPHKIIITQIYIEDIVILTSGTQRFQKAVLIAFCYAFFVVGFYQLSFQIFYLEPDYLCYDNHNSKFTFLNKNKTFVILNFIIHTNIYK
jgi:hypothetical protein